jgi:hypothetical protein
MKKKTLNSKLFLNKETVTVLNNYQSSKIIGGEGYIVKGDSLAQYRQDSVAEFVRQDSVAVMVRQDTVQFAKQDSLAL